MSWLDELKVGDEVIVASYSIMDRNTYKLATVERRTKTLIIVDGKRFGVQGQQTGERRYHSSNSWLVEPTTVFRQRAVEDQARRILRSYVETLVQDLEGFRRELQDPKDRWSVYDANVSLRNRLNRELKALEDADELYTDQLSRLAEVGADAQDV